jgi:hypothetical protein
VLLLAAAGPPTVRAVRCERYAALSGPGRIGGWWKLTDEDWRNRRRRKAYEHAVDDMLERTDHAGGRWTLVEAENKRWARVKVLETVVAALESGLQQHGVHVPAPPAVG